MRDFLLSPPVVTVVVLLAVLGLTFVVLQAQYEYKKRKEYRDSYRIAQKREQQRGRQIAREDKR